MTSPVCWKTITIGPVMSLPGRGQRPDRSLPTHRRAAEPSLAELVIDNDGDFSYTPPSNWAGVDSFNYTIESPSGQMATAEVDINVYPAPPTITAPASETVTENVDPALTGIIVGDISANS